ncbi:MAG: D-cysteine desulfhydrase family protein [Gammaproteobacteria bacterium]|nr:D-cysteine desulfhydrase family protein [Gammaproteobacteria bacterium]
MSNAEAVAQVLGRFPRVRLAHTPTPLEQMPRLTERLGGARLWVKRDDCTGLSMGGNKARQIEFYLGDALEQGATTIITTGAVQSNHVRITAAACGRLGLACEVQLEDRVKDMPDEYRQSGSPLLSRLHGARIHLYPEGEDEHAADSALESIAERVRAEGGKPYVIHLGAEHPPLGALGYLDAAAELLRQADEADLHIDAIVLPSGSASTHLGVLAGFAISDANIPVYGICIRRDAESQGSRIALRSKKLSALLGGSVDIDQSSVLLDDNYLGPGYGKTTPELFEAMSAAASLEGLLLDPIYSGKCFAGLIGLVRSGTFAGDANVVFLHTGGVPALFGYTSLFQRVLERDVESGVSGLTAAERS